MTDGISGAASSQYLGQYSGVSSATIDQLVQADAIPMTLMQDQVANLQVQQGAWGDVRTSLNNFLTDVKVLQNTDTYNAKVATSSNTKVATITGDDTAEIGSHDVIVQQLASASKWTGTRVNSVPDSKTALKLTGTLALDLTPEAETITGTDEQVATVAAFKLSSNTTTATPSTTSKLILNIQANDTLGTIVEQVNAQTKQTDIAAAIVDNHLVLSSIQTGKAKFSVDSSSSDGIANNLGLQIPQSTTAQGQAAIFSLDGLAIGRTSNSVTDVLDGATINLTGVSANTTTNATPTPTNLTLTADTKKFETAVNTMVTQYNSLMGVINTELDPGDPSKSGNQSGSLVGDSNLMELQEELENMVTGSQNGTGTSKAYNTADSVGISFIDKSGTLGLDSTKFENALATNPSAVKNFFYQGEVNKVTGVATNESGYTFDLGRLANKYLVSSTGNQGIIALQTAGYDSTIKDLNSQISNFQDQLTAKRAAYVTQFSALDSYMAQAQSQLAYFTRQIG